MSRSPRAALAHFVEEAQATAQLQHPHIVPVYDIGVAGDGRLWFTMREGPRAHDGRGESVRCTRAPRRTWTMRRLVAAFFMVCQAVGFAHERGVVHRDLKPANIMLGEHGEVYVVDWGLAKISVGPCQSAVGRRW